MSFDPKQKGYRIGAEEAGTLVANPLEASDGHHGHSSPRGDGADNLVVGGTLKGQRGKGGGGIGPEETLVVAETLTAPKPDHELRDGKRQDGGRRDKVPIVAVPISGDAMRRSGEAKTPSADAEGNVRLRDPGLGVGDEGDPAFTISAASPGAVAAPLSHGSNPNSNAAGRRREDDENLVFETRFARNGRGAPDSICPPLKAQSGETGKGDGAPMVISPTIGADVGNSVGGHPGLEEYAGAVHAASASVRRLTPTECERLQGLPDGWTQLGGTPDSRRYASLGDAVTASVGLWIGQRLIVRNRA